MISRKIAQACRYHLSLGASSYLAPHAMKASTTKIVESLEALGITEEEFKAITVDEAPMLGFSQWDEATPNFYLIPQWMYAFIPKGMQVTSIGGVTKAFDKSVHDNETRFGSLAYGLVLASVDTKA